MKFFFVFVFFKKKSLIQNKKCSFFVIKAKSWEQHVLMAKSWEQAIRIMLLWKNPFTPNEHLITDQHQTPHALLEVANNQQR